MKSHFCWRLALKRRGKWRDRFNRCFVCGTVNPITDSWHHLVFSKCGHSTTGSFMVRYYTNIVRACKLIQQANGKLKEMCELESKALGSVQELLRKNMS